MIEGALVLTLAMVIVKIVGALYKLPMIGIIGEDGNGFYTTAYNLYSTIYSLAVTGFPVAVSKIVSSYATQGRYRDIRQVKRVSTVFFGILGVVASAALALLAKPYVESINNAGALYCVLAVSPSLLFSCLMSTHRGYNQGMKNMTPTAVSQVVEVLFKAAFGLGGAYLVKAHFVAEYAAAGTVLGQRMADAAAADVMIASLAAAGSIFGVSMSTFAGWLFLVIRSWYVGDGVRATQLLQSPKPYSNKHLLGQICRVVLPIALSSAAVSITGLIDNYSVLGRLQMVAENSLQTLYASHGGVLEQAERTVAQLPNYLYGVYGLGITLFNLVPSLTGSFGMSALPHVTSAWVAGDKQATRLNMESMMRVTMLIAAPCGMGLAFLAGPIADLIYGAKTPIGAQLVVPMLSLLGIAAIFVAVVNPINALLQAVGKYSVPVVLMIIGGGIKLASNYFLVAVPQLNIKAAPMGNLLCFLFIMIASYIILSRATGIRFSTAGIFVKPLLAGALCGASAMLAYNLLTRYASLPAKLSTVGAIGAAALVYLVALSLLGAIAREDVLGLPGGGKICRILEKIRVIR